MSVPILYQGSKYKPRPFVPIPVLTAPHFSSAEVGTVNTSTVAVTFDSNVLADGSDYSSGVTIKVNGSTRAFESGIRQANHAVVYYALSTPVVFGDTVTWEYASGSGAIVGETGGMALGDVSAQSVTNNVAQVDPIGDTLRADAIAYWKMDEPNGTRIDATPNGRDLIEYLTVEAATGKINNATKFVDDTENAQELDWNGSDVSLSNAVSIWGWTKFNQFIGADNGKSNLVNAYDQGGSGLSFDVSVGIMSAPGSDMDIEVSSGALKSESLSINTWHFFVYWHQSGTDYLKVDGGSTSSVPRASFPPVFNTVTIGLPGYVNNTDTVYIDELGILARVITSDEIAYLYNSGAGRALFPAP